MTEQRKTRSWWALLVLVGGIYFMAYRAEPLSVRAFFVLSALLPAGVFALYKGLPESRGALLSPVLLALMMVCFLWGSNPGEVEGRYLFEGLLCATLGALLLSLLARLLIRDPLRAAVVAGIAVLIFLLYGHAFNALYGLEIVQDQSLLNTLLAVAALGGFVGLCFLVLRSQKPLGGLLAFLSLTASLSIGFSLFQSAWHRFNLDRSARPAEGAEPAAVFAGLPDPGPAAEPLLEEQETLPDVYYIILDAYVRQDMCSGIFQHDNWPFLKALQSRGFYVGNRSTSNYSSTYLSLCSSLNISYLDEVAERVGRESPARAPFNRLTANNWVGRYFRSKGYRFAQVYTMAGASVASDIADIRYQYASPRIGNEFTTVLLQTTALRGLVPSVADSHLYALNKIKETASINGPTFLFAHILLPHPPYVFSRDGEVDYNVPLTLHWDVAERRKIGNRYIDQVVYLNARVTEIVDHILAESETDPVIIIQADHGWNGTGPPKDDSPEAWAPVIRQKFAILNALRVPDAMKEQLYPDISPVNTFRLLVNTLFGEQLELLPDRCYFSRRAQAPLAWEDVSSVAREK